MSRFAFQADLPDPDRREWDRLRQELTPPRTLLQRLRAAPGGGLIAIVPVVVAAAAIDSVDHYKTGWAMLPEASRRDVASANVELRRSEIAAAARDATGIKHLRAEGIVIGGLVFRTVGPRTIVRVQPPTRSASLRAIVDGTDGYHGDFPLTTDASGESSFDIPPPKFRPVLDRVVVSATGSAATLTATATFIW